MRDILRAAIEAEKDNLLRKLGGARSRQRAALLEEVAACESLLGRLGRLCSVLYQIREQPPPNEPLAKREAGRNTDLVATLDPRAIYRGL